MRSVSALRSILVTSLVLLNACGDSSAVGTTPKPPITEEEDHVPASMVVSSGAGQVTEPGQSVSVQPVVIVRNAAGAALTGIPVTFTVDSGGGSVQGGTVTTGATGAASPAEWRLGNTEGRNVLRVNAGALAPVRISAIAQFGSRLLADSTFVSGTIEITTGALQGTKLVVPAGAFSGVTTWTLTQRPPSTWPARPNVQVAGPVIHVTATASGPSAIPMTLTLPATVPEGTRPFVLMRNVETNNIEVLQTVSVDAGTITVAVQRFEGNAIMSPTNSVTSAAMFRLFSGSTVASYDVDVVVANIPVAELDKNIDTGFRPGVDDWDFPSLRTSLRGPLIADSEIDLGVVITEMAWFASNKAQQGALFGKYREMKDVPLSNRTGLRAAAEFSTTQRSVITASLVTIRNSMRAGQADQVFYDVIKANMLLSGLPQMMVVNGAQGSFPVVAYRVTNGKVDFSNPSQPGASSSVQFASGHFAPTTVVIDQQGTAMPSSWIGSSAIAQWINMSSVAQRVLQIADGASSAMGSWPRGDVRARGGLVEDTILYFVDDTTRFWVDCPTCATGFTSASIPGLLEPFAAYFLANNVLSVFSSDGPTGKLVAQTTAADTRLGFVMFESDANNTIRWLDFKWMRAKRWVMTLPDNSALAGEEKSYTLNVDGPVLPAHTFRWTFGSGAGARVFTTSAPTVQVKFDEEGTFPLNVEILRTSDSKTIATMRSTVDIVSMVRWRLTSATPIQQSANDDDFTALLANPSEWVLFVFLKNTPGISAAFPTPGAYLQRQAVAAGAPVTFANSGARTIPVAHQFVNPGPRVTGFYIWTGGIHNGTLTGNGTPLNQTCTQFLGNIQATKSGETISGEIGRSINRLAGCDGGAVDFVNRASFVGTRIVN